MLHANALQQNNIAFTDGSCDTMDPTAPSYGAHMLVGKLPTTVKIPPYSGPDRTTYAEMYTVKECAKCIHPNEAWTIYTDNKNIIDAYKGVSILPHAIQLLLDYVRSTRPMIDIRFVPSYHPDWQKSIYTLCNHIVDKVAYNTRMGRRADVLFEVIDGSCYYTFNGNRYKCILDLSLPLDQLKNPDSKNRNRKKYARRARKRSEKNLDSAITSSSSSNLIKSI
jgi:hypothetical protein